jgi:hypothetical protein
MTTSSSHIYADDDIGDHGLSFCHEPAPDQYTSFLPSAGVSHKPEKDVALEVSSLRRPISDTSISRSKRHFLLLDWKWEIAATIVSYAAMLALVFVLRAYGNFDETRWAWKDVSLNTIVADYPYKLHVPGKRFSLMQAGLTNARRAAQGRCQVND